MDEAMHPLTLLVVGLYGEVLPAPDGAPLRLAVPWKYGFKHAKSIVRIRFVEKQPINSWQQYAANGYGFYANVNPTVDHPRWSQTTRATHRRVLPAQDADVQRLCGPSAVAVRGNGSAKELLMLAIVWFTR